MGIEFVICARSMLLHIQVELYMCCAEDDGWLGDDDDDGEWRIEGS